MLSKESQKMIDSFATFLLADKKKEIEKAQKLTKNKETNSSVFSNKEIEISDILYKEKEFIPSKKNIVQIPKEIKEI